MKISCAFCLIFFLVVFATAQSGITISGIVTNENRPVGDTEVTLTPDDNKGVVIHVRTNEDGRYRFENIKPGIYTIRIAGGPVDENVTVRGNVPLNVDFTQGPSLPSIRESVTVAAGASQSIDEVSKTVNVIDGQEMRERADFTLVDTLRSIPGFRVQQ